MVAKVKDVIIGVKQLNDERKPFTPLKLTRGALWSLKRGYVRHTCISLRQIEIFEVSTASRSRI